MKSNLTLAIIAYNAALIANGEKDPMNKVVTIGDLLDITKMVDLMNQLDEEDNQ